MEPTCWGSRARRLTICLTARAVFRQRWRCGWPKRSAAVPKLGLAYNWTMTSPKCVATRIRSASGESKDAFSRKSKSDCECSGAAVDLHEVVDWVFAAELF